MSILFSQYDPAKTYAGQKKFDCGNAAINKFAADSLKQQVAKALSVAFVLTDSADNGRFIGFYTSMMASIDASALHGRGSLPRHVPCMRLVMLGIDMAHKGKHLGRQLLLHAISCIVRVSADVGVYGLYLDAAPEAVEFYLQHGFAKLEAFDDARPTPMFLHIETARKAMVPH